MNSGINIVPDQRRRECENEYPNCRPGRVVGEGTHLYRVVTETGEYHCRVSGKYRHRANIRSDFPVVGDYVALEPAGDMIAGLLKRGPTISRKSAGRRTEEQILAANVDLGIVVAALDGGRNFTSRGVERYTTTIWESGAEPLLVLNKLDACADPAASLVRAEELVPGVRIILTSALTGDGLEELRQTIGTGVTAVLIGPSGVGKSSLINSLVGEERLSTGVQREHDRTGRHTSTARSLVRLNSGGSLIDTPGLRELQLWADEESLGRTFSELDGFAEGCRFRDCTHQDEPGCAVQAAVAAGELSSERYASYLSLQKELAYLHRRSDEAARKEEVNRWKEIQRSVKHHHKRQGR